MYFVIVAKFCYLKFEKLGRINYLPENQTFIALIAICVRFLMFYGWCEGIRGKAFIRQGTSCSRERVPTGGETSSTEILCYIDPS